MSKNVAYILVLLTILFTVFGQLIIKAKAGQMGHLPVDWMGRISYAGELFLSPYIIAGVTAGGFAAFCWILALTRLSISYAYPFMALTFPIVVIAGHMFFGEQVKALQYVGVALICSGVMLVNYSS